MQQLTNVTLLTIARWLLIFKTKTYDFFVCIDFLPGSRVIPTLELIGVGGLLPRMIFHRLEPMFDYPEKWDFPIYIYTVSLFLGFFDDF